MDADHLGNLPPPILARRTRPARALALTQQRNELAAQLPTRVGIDGVVDRLVRDVPGGVKRMHAPECAGNLLGRPAPHQQITDHAPQGAIGVQLAQGPGIDTSLLTGCLRGRAGVARCSAVARQLTAETAGAAPQRLGNGSQAEALLVQRGQRHAFFALQVRVSCSHRCNLPHVGVLHFGVETAVFQRFGQPLNGMRMKTNIHFINNQQSTWIVVTHVALQLVEGCQ